ncbi:hypothetical protein GIB67_028476 [Kingdonia uniflora]|uniref:Uncharacterized protein n=1 Tax=Kingdonia uniflora TaxID=39325 RepID=A0A7J7P1X2_9MAGN|nr:hypothetical protein GIB67_028476 [Kingdonia uniflora]
MTLNTINSDICPDVNVDDAINSGQEITDNLSKDSSLYNLLYPSKDLLPDDKEMSIYDHLEELRQRVFISVLAVGAAILGCFAFSKDLIMILEAPVRSQGVRFLQLAPGEFFFTTIKVKSNEITILFIRSYSLWFYIIFTLF